MSVMFLKHLVCEYNCDAGMSVKNVPAVVTTGKNYEGTIYCTHVLVWVDGGYGEECGKNFGRVLLASLQSSIQVVVRNVLLDSKTRQGILRGR